MKKNILTPIFSAAVLITTPLWAMVESELFSDPAKTYTMSMNLPQKWLGKYDPSELSARTLLRQQSQYSYTAKVITETGTFTLNVYTYSNVPLASLTSEANLTLNTHAHAHKSLNSLNSLKPDMEVVFTPLLNVANEEDKENSADFIFLVYPKGYIDGEDG